MIAFGARKSTVIERNINIIEGTLFFHPVVLFPLQEAIQSINR